MSLIVPKHVAATLAAKRDGAVADSIGKTSINRMTSDDFVSPEEVLEQLVELHEYVAAQREVHESYQLPRPSGWKIAVLMLTIPEMTQGGLHMVSEQREAKAVASPQGVILSMGPAAYKDPERFSVDGFLNQWHKPGDRILWVKYDATTFQLANGQRIGFMTDTQPMATIDTGWEVPQ